MFTYRFDNVPTIFIKLKENKHLPFSMFVNAVHLVSLWVIRKSIKLMPACWKIMLKFELELWKTSIFNLIIPILFIYQLHSYLKFDIKKQKQKIQKNNYLICDKCICGLIIPVFPDNDPYEYGTKLILSPEFTCNFIGKWYLMQIYID